MNAQHPARLIASVLALGLLLVPSGATRQVFAGQEPPPAPAAPSRSEEDAAKAQTARERTPSRNVRVTVTLTDQLGTSTPVVRSAVLTIADGRQGLVRSSTTVRRTTPPPAGQIVVPGVEIGELPLSVDAVVEITPSNAVLLRLGFNYRVYGSPAGDGANIEVTRRDLTENLTVLLESGKALVVSESADAISDRKVKVEVKAEIL